MALGRPLKFVMRKIQRMTMPVAVLSLLIPLPGPLKSSLSAEDTQKDLAPTCASVYSAISGSAADKNYLAMVHEYYIFSSLSEERAAEESANGARRIYKAISEGRLNEGDIMGTAKTCSAQFGIPLPISLNENLVPSYVTKTQSVAVNRHPEPAPVESEADSACARANADYVSALHTIPAQMDRAGSPGLENGQRNSKYYYTLGKICDSMKVAENAVGKSCGWAEQPKKLDVC